MLSFWLSFWIHSTFCNHAEQLQHQGPVQPLLLRNGQRQPWFVVSAVGAGCGLRTVGTVLSLAASINLSASQFISSLTSYHLAVSLRCTEPKDYCSAFSLHGGGLVMLLLFLSVQSFATESRLFLNFIYMLKLSVQNILHCYCTVVFAVSLR